MRGAHRRLWLASLHLQQDRTAGYAKGLPMQRMSALTSALIALGGAGVAAVKGDASLLGFKAAATAPGAAGALVVATDQQGDPVLLSSDVEPRDG